MNSLGHFHHLIQHEDGVGEKTVSKMHVMDWIGVVCSVLATVGSTEWVARYTTPPVVQPRRSLALIALHKSYARIGEHAQGLSAYGPVYSHLPTSKLACM